MKSVDDSPFILGHKTFNRVPGTNKDEKYEITNLQNFLARSHNFNTFASEAPSVRYYEAADILVFLEPGG